MNSMVSRTPQINFLNKTKNLTSNFSWKANLFQTPNTTFVNDTRCFNTPVGPPKFEYVHLSSF